METNNDFSENPSFDTAIAVHGIGTVGSYYPLQLQWNNTETGKKWALSVKSYPEKEITFEGDAPTTGEMAELILKCGDMRHCLLEVFMVLADICRVPSNQSGQIDDSETLA